MEATPLSSGFLSKQSSGRQGGFMYDAVHQQEAV